MKIKPGTYKERNPERWISFKYAYEKDVSNTFIRRLAAFCEHVGRGMYIVAGSRSAVKQKALYDANVKAYPPNGNGTVAAPGKSWHGGGCAVDVQDEGFWMSYFQNGDMNKAVKQQELYGFGLCLPMNKVENTVHEWWHIQPVETIGYIGDRNTFLGKGDILYSEVSKMDIRAFQKAMGLTDDGKAGPLTKAKAAELLPLLSEIIGADNKSIIQAFTGFSYPQGVWDALDKHPYASDLYDQWAKSYLNIIGKE